jgi:hypothetical protein
VDPTSQNLHESASLAPERSFIYPADVVPRYFRVSPQKGQRSIKRLRAGQQFHRCPSRARPFTEITFKGFASGGNAIVPESVRPQRRGANPDKVFQPRAWR